MGFDKLKAREKEMACRESQKGMGMFRLWGNDSFEWVEEVLVNMKY